MMAFFAGSGIAVWSIIVWYSIKFLIKKLRKKEPSLLFDAPFCEFSEKDTPLGKGYINQMYRKESKQ